MLNKKYDFVVSIGEDCACTSYLRRCNLQFLSYPFDWLTHATFQTRIDLICNNFENFFNKQDFFPIEKNIKENHDKNCDYYHNAKTDFYFYHDFPINVPLEDSFKNVQEKYNRRISYLYDKINKANNILFVWWSRNKIISQDELILADKKLKEKFPNKNINLLIIEYKSIKNFEYENISKNVLKIKYDNISYKHNPRWNDTMGNEKNNLYIFRQIKLKLSFYQKIKKIIFFIKLFFVKFIFIKKIRHKLRNKITKEYSHATL